jgi:hypothetical protein
MGEPPGKRGQGIVASVRQMLVAGQFAAMKGVFLSFGKKLL